MCVCEREYVYYNTTGKYTHYGKALNDGKNSQIYTL